MEMSMRKRPRPQQFRNYQFNQAHGKRPRHNAISYAPRPPTIPPTIPSAIPSGAINVLPNGGSYSIATVLSTFATLLAQGERGAPSIQVLLNNLTPNMLADLVIANMVHLPSSRDPRATLYLRTNDSSVIVKHEPVEAERINISNQVVKQEPVEVERSNISNRVVKQEPIEVESINTSDRSGKSLAKRVQLSGDQKTACCVASLVRILENHKTIKAAGGGELRSALLARLVTEITEFLKIIERHILKDYEAHKAHELGLHILYQLYADQPTIYDQFLLSLAQGLQGKSKSLNRLLSEAPEVTMTALKLVEELCIANSSEQVTAGLTALWTLILQRPPLRDTCLKLVLKCTIHESENTRGKAVRLVANKLYQLHYVAQSIEDFATSSFYSVVNQKEESSERPVVAPVDGEAKSTKALSLPEAQQSMALFFALCTKKHALFWELLKVYGEAPKAVKQAIDKQISILVRTIGSSSQELLQLMAYPPAGSENLVKQIQTALSTLRE